MTLTAMLPALAGANVIYGLGMLESGITFDYGKLVMDNEFARMIQLVVNGILINDETLAVDIINDVGPFKEFISHEHTMKHMYSQSKGELINRKIRERWVSAGSTDIYERATEKAKWILENHQPEPLSENVRGEMRAIIEKAEKELECT